MKVIKLLFFLLICVTGFSQMREPSINYNHNQAINYLKQYKLDSAKKVINHPQIPKNIKDIFVWYYEYLLQGTIQKFPVAIENKNDTIIENAIIKLYYGDYLNLLGADPSLSYRYYFDSKNYSQKLGDSTITCEALKRLANQVNTREKDHKQLDSLTNEYINYAYDSFEKDLSYLYKIRAKSLIKEKHFINDFKFGLESAITNNNEIVQAHYYKLLGVKYDVYAKKILTELTSINPYKESLIHYNKALAIYNKYPYYISKKRKVGVLLNKGINYHYQKDYDSAILYYKKMKALVEDTDFNHLILYKHWLGNSLDSIGEYAIASKLRAEENKLLRDDIKKRAEVNLSEINTKYEVDKKEKENIKLESNIEKTNRKNRNLWIGSIAALLFVASTAFLIQKNTKRKQKLAEQEKALESQKLATVLKEQELVTIDAMIEGQEKERQRIANDLHDDLGGLMATVKLHFNALKDKGSPELFEKTNDLIEEAYQKVRSVAHAKNSGVIARQGLLKAVKHMADKVSTSNTLTIEVIDHGLDQRLENSLELTLFRIIQELITNVVKHAQASETNIHLTNHEDSINIMVEDNGKGFNPSQITKTNKGMGISSIDRRVEHLDGKLTIESEENKGTTIIIDIPI